MAPCTRETKKKGDESGEELRGESVEAPHEMVGVAYMHSIRG